jgi:hypothetical protein
MYVYESACIDTGIFRLVGTNNMTQIFESRIEIANLLSI